MELDEDHTAGRVVFFVVCVFNGAGAFLERTPVRTCAEKAFIAHFPVDLGRFHPVVFYTVQSYPD